MGGSELNGLSPNGPKDVGPHHCKGAPLRNAIVPVEGSAKVAVDLKTRGERMVETVTGARHPGGRPR